MFFCQGAFDSLSFFNGSFIQRKGIMGKKALVFDDNRGLVYGVLANWAEASCPVLQLAGEPTSPDEWEWVSTPFQVADFRHDPHDALRWAMDDAASPWDSTGDDEADNESLEKAVAAAKWYNEDGTPDEDDCISKEADWVAKGIITKILSEDE
jgi:hypothetical protein